MSKHISTVILTCQSLQQKGMRPTVALVKKHAQTSLPLPDIISGLQRWKSAPDQKVNLAAQSIPNNAKDAQTLKYEALVDRISALESQVALLMSTHNTQR